MDISHLKDIYGTLTNLEEECSSCKICWQGYEQYKLNYPQTPYLPYRGNNCRGIIFCGINLNEGNTSLDAIDSLVSSAKGYLLEERFKIFKSTDYGGTSFYYYVPLLSFMYKSMMDDQREFATENDISWPDVQNGFDYCSMTNLIKCSVGTPDRRSTPNYFMSQQCGQKFKVELNHLEYSSLVTFSYFKYPNLIAELFPHALTVVEHDRWRLSRNEEKWLLELEHPMSSKVTRVKKFQEYYAAFRTLVEQQRMRIATL